MMHRFLLFTLIMFSAMMLSAQTPSIVLDGSNDYVGSYGDILDIGTSDWSFQVWFNAPPTTTRGGIIGKSVYGSVVGRWGAHFAESNPGVLRVLVQFTPTASLIIDPVPTAAGTWNDGNWHQITVTLDRDGLLTIYMDGAYNTSTSIATYNGINLNSAGHFWIGAYGNSTGTAPQLATPNMLFAGSVDEARVWNKALSAAEVAANYNVEIPSPQTNLVGYWQMNEDTGNLIYDLSGNNYTGTLYGGITWGDGPTTLPIELSSFTATITSQYFVRLHWVTQSETDALGYIVFRSLENDLASAIQASPLIDATNTATQVSYEFTDTEVTPGTWYYWLQSLDLNGNFNFHGPILATVSTEQGGEAPPIPTATGISKVYPNPFNPSLTIRYELKEALPVSFKIYNARGQMVQSYDLGTKEAASYDLIWDANGFPSGIYLIRMQAGNKLYNCKAVLSK